MSCSYTENLLRTVKRETRKGRSVVGFKVKTQLVITRKSFV